MSATELAQAVRRRRLSPVEITRDILQRIAELEPSLNVFATLAPERALRAAREAEAKLMRGDVIGPLHGVPFTVKDMIAARGMRMAFGSRARRDFTPDFDAPAVARLEQAGAILLGKTTTSEFGWTAKGVSPLTGVTRNPWNHALDAGGSSAGAAAAAAAGMAPLHLATDGAGSIRIPAHFCGVFGFKPSYGVVPQFPISVNDYTSHPGPITRTVADAAVMLQVMAGQHPADHTSSAAPVPNYADLLRAPSEGRARIAFSRDLGHARVEKDVAAVVSGAVVALQAALALDVADSVPAWAPRGPELVRFFWPAHLSRFAAMGAEERQMLDPALLACAQQGLRLTVADYQGARERKYAYCSEIGRFFEEWDFLLTPSASVAAFPPDHLQPPGWPQHPWDWLSWAEFGYPANFAGCPAASVPCGLTPDGRPVGLQIMGRRFDDLGVLRLAARFNDVLSDKMKPQDSRHPAKS